MKVAVIISDVVSQGKLLKCVRSLCRQSHNNYEIVLPDLGNFGRKEHRALRQIEKEHAFFRVFCNPKRNRAEIINAAVMSTSCELLLFTESHCIVDQNWIADWVSVFEKGGVSVATGSRIISSSRSWVSRAEKDLNREIRARARKIQNASAYLDMHNTAITKDCFTNLGGLNKNLPLMAEFELGARLHQQSVHIERVEHIKVLHFNDTRLISYSNGIAAHGRDRTRMLIQHGRRFMKSYFPNPRLIRYRKTLTSLRLPVLICLKILLSCSVAGFGLGRLLNMYPVSLYFFRHVARNSLRYGEVSALK